MNFDTPTHIFLGVIAFSFFVSGFLIGICHKRPKIYYLQAGDDGWLPIEGNPIPDDAVDILISDGDKVSSEYKLMYNSKGAPIMRGSIATHWRPLPAPPKATKKVWLKKVS